MNEKKIKKENIKKHSKPAIKSHGETKNNENMMSNQSSEFK